MGYIPKEHVFQGYNDPTPRSHPPLDDYSLGATQFVSSVPFGGTSSSCGSKCQTPMIDLMDS